MSAPRFYIKDGRLTHLNRLCSGWQPLAALSDVMASAGFCPKCAPGWRLITTPNAADPDFVDISIQVGGVATLLLAGEDGYTEAYYAAACSAALDPEVEAALEAAACMFVREVSDFMKRPVYTVPGDWTYHYGRCPHLARRSDVREHLGRNSDELKGYVECGCSVCALWGPEYTVPPNK